MGQDNYRYDKLGLDVQLTDDRAKNGATALTGYSLNVQPDSNWPGLEHSGAVDVKPDQVSELARQLEDRAGQVDGLGEWLLKATNVSFGPTDWHEANNLRDASQLVAGNVAQFVKDTVTNLNQAAQSLYGVRDHYTKSESENTRLMRPTGLPDVEGPTGM